MAKAAGDKVQRAQTYLSNMEQRLKSAKSGMIPEKHKTSKEAETGYLQFLEIEIRKAKLKLNQLQGIS